MHRYDVKEGRFKPEQNGRKDSAPQPTLEEWMAQQEGKGRTGERRPPVLPIEPVLRPEHPTLGGPLVLHGVPAALDNKEFDIVEAWYKRVFEDLPGSVTSAKLYLARAKEASKAVHNAYHSCHEKHDQRIEAARKAREAFAQIAYDLQKMMTAATEAPVARLREWESELNQTQKDMTQAIAEPGTPAVAIRRYLENTEKKIAPAQRKTPSASEAEQGPGEGKTGETTEAAPDKTAGRPPDWEAIVRSLCSLPGGALIGLCLGEELRYLEKLQMKAWETDSLGWMIGFGAVGVGAVHLFAKGMSKLWEQAGSAASEEPASTARFVNWRTVRHAVFPLLVTAVVCAVEASIVRNSIVHSNTIQDSDNPAYFLGALPVILPTALASAAFGWHRGRKQVREASPPEEAHALQVAEEARQEAIRVEETVAAAPEAQKVVAFAYRIDTLHVWIAGVKEEIAALLEPYEYLLAKYRADLDAAPIDPEFRKILQQAYEDATACFGDFLREHGQLTRRMEGVYVGGDIFFHHYWAKSYVSPPVNRPSGWQRFRAFLVRVFGRNTAGGAK